MGNIDHSATTDAASEQEYDDFLYMEVDDVDIDDEPNSNAERLDVSNAILSDEDPEPIRHWTGCVMGSKTSAQIAEAETFHDGSEESETDRWCNTGTMFDTLPEMEIIIENLYVM